MGKNMPSFYDHNGNKVAPSWFALDVERISDELLGGMGDFGNPADVATLQDMWKAESKDIFHQIGVFVVNLMMHHCNRKLPIDQYMPMGKDFIKLYRYHLGKIDDAYSKWETKKGNLKNKD